MISERFAEFAVRARTADLEKGVQFAAVRATVDWFAVASAGATAPAATILRDAMLEEGSTGHSMLIGSPRLVEASSAALINGTASHAVEFDDIYREGIYHPGAPTVAAALAVAQRLAKGGGEFLRVVAVGYEIGDRVAEAMIPAHYRFWHPTGTVGAIGAAAAVAELLALDENQFAHALSMATTMAAGLQQSFRSDAMSKPLHAGHAAQAGVISGLGAARGFTGALDIFEGDAGFGAAMGQNPDWAAATSSLGEPWLIQSPTVKIHSCCGHTFAALDGALQLRGDGIDVNRITHISIETYEIAIRIASNPNPTSASEARFSIQYCVAAALVLGSVRLLAFEPEALADQRLRHLVNLTSASVAPEFDAGFPHQRAARVTVTFVDGQQSIVERWTRKGDPEDPVSDEELRGKYSELAAPLYGAAMTARTGEMLWALEELPDMRLLHFDAPQR